MTAQRPRTGKGYRHVLPAFPPEFNSGRIYAGPGSGPMSAAATAWDELATELQSTAASYSAVISGLTSGPWIGPSSLSMAAAVTPLPDLDAGHRCPGRRGREPGHRGGKRLRDGVCGARATGGDRDQPHPIGLAGGYERFRSEHPWRSQPPKPIRRNVGTGRGGDGHLRRFVGGRLERDTVHPGAPDHQPRRGGRPGGRGGPSRCHLGRKCPVDPSTSTSKASPLQQWLANLSTDYTDTLNGLLNGLFGPVGHPRCTALYNAIKVPLGFTTGFNDTA